MPEQRGVFYIHGIHTSSLRNRQPALHQSMQSLRLAAQKAGFEVIPRLVLSPNPSDIQEALKNYEGRIDYSKPTDPPFASEIEAHIHTLNLQEISNLEKHRKVWEFIGTSTSPEGLHMVIEDDVTLHPESVSSLPEVIQQAAASGGLTALCTMKRPLWLSKECYIISHAVASELFAATQKIKFNVRGHLSLWAIENQDRTTYARATIDGSKLGLFPSAVHTHNPLIFNKDYNEMLEIMATTKGETAIAAYIPRFDATCTKMSPPSPDFLHLLGILNHRAGQNARAKELFMMAINEIVRQGGILSTTSEILTNALAINKHLQDTDFNSLPSKYEKMSSLPLV